MKIIIAIVANEDNNKVASNLTKKGFSVTKLSTTGGFLMSGNTTMLIGTQDEKVDEAISIIGQYSKKRKKIVPSTSYFGMGVNVAIPVEVNIGGATIFVIDVDRYEKL